MSLAALAFDNTHLRSLPVADDLDADSSLGDDSSAGRLVGACLARFTPRPVSEPVLAAVSEPALRLLGLDAAAAGQPSFLHAIAGAELLPGAQQHAALPRTSSLCLLAAPAMPTPACWAR